MLEVRLRHAFSGFTLDAGFTAPQGVTVLCGRSGSGKSTVVHAVAGLLRPDEGRVVRDGEVLTDTAAGLWTPPHRRRVGCVFQDARLFPHLTVTGNLTYGRWFARRRGGASPAAGFDQVVDLLGLAPLLHRTPGALSGGERQRVALGRAILSDPRLLLMDEPLSALDEARKAEVLPYLERMRDLTGLPILYVSHSMAEVARLATTVVLMEGGRVVLAGPAADVLSDPAAAPALGLREAGAVIRARVAVADDGDGLMRLSCAGGAIWLPRADLPAGAEVRLRVLAQDILLSRGRPEGLSALNILPARVTELREGEGPGVLVRLALGSGGEEALLARVTRRSARALGLETGAEVHAILKAVAVAPGALGRAVHSGQG